ncbi:MAG TPA: hypothetical protein VEA59_03230 [Patescibacteria group bacterium]|nr:hypothetical protein [Patescibacteria group bacterium]
MKRHQRKAARWVTRLVESTGIPHTYSTTVAWFAERMVLATICLMTLSFSAGALFVLKLVEPISNSAAYDIATEKARHLEEGIKTFSQEVIDIASPVFTAFIKEYRYQGEITMDHLAVRKEKLRKYLTEKKSPFAHDEAALDAFVNSKNMKMMVAISFVESTFGKHCYYYNCSGIGGTPPTLRKYDSYADWIRDFDSLLERRYKDLPPEKFIGLYVQPGSPNWIYGVKKVLREFQEIGIDSPEPTQQQNS